MELEKQSAQAKRDRVMSVLFHLGRILTELRQHLESGTVVTTIIVRATTLNTLHSRTNSYCAAGCGGLGGGTRTVFGAGGAKAKIF
jgi:hypothetical protein